MENVKRKCPVCKQPAEWEPNPHRPFCGERCKNIDLAKWATESYKIESEDAPSSEEDPSEF